MSHQQSRRDLHRESQHPNQAQPSPAHLSTPPTHPIHPTTSTSTYEIPTLDGPTNIRDISAPVASAPPSQTEREEPPTTDQSPRPVSRVVARDRALSARYVVDRDGDVWQSVGDGTWRCLTTTSCTVLGCDLVNVCGPLTELVSADLRVELERTEGDLGVALREANHHRALVAKAAELHQADPVDPYWCAACQTSAWPCPTAAALATAAPS